MPIPFSFVIGLLCLFGAEELLGTLPLDPDPLRLLPYLGLLIVPWVFARLGAYRVDDSLDEPLDGALGRFTGRPRWQVRLRRLLRTLPRRATVMLLVPAVFLPLVAYGGLTALVSDWARRLGIDSSAVNLVIPILLLMGLELSVDLGARRAASPRQLLPPYRFAWIAFATVPVLTFHVGLDLLALNREVEVFAIGTGVGALAGLLVLIVVMALVLPVAFRMIMPTSRWVPEDVLLTANQLNFPAADVIQLRTDNRMVNAALVGPVPGFRFLFLSDGLLRILDPVSLCGVVAHEVGHARGGHPMLLFILFLFVPLLLVQPLEALGFTELSGPLQFGLLGVAAGLGTLALRRVAHRFELEADQLSSEALGGAMPCILALQKVGELFGEAVTKSSLRHPSEDRRIDNLLRCDGDPWFRERFLRSGWRLRRGIAALVLVAVAANVWAQTALWPYDRLVWTFYTGRFDATERALTAVSAPGEDRPARAEFVEELAEELWAARSLYPHGGPWQLIRRDMATKAWTRGYRELLRAGQKATDVPDAVLDAAASARPWFALAMAKPHPTAFERSLYRLSAAAAHGDRARFETIRRHLAENFSLDEGLSRALAATE